MTTDYRSDQSTKLKLKADIFKNDFLQKHKSIDLINSDDCVPIQSKDDIELLDKLINTQNFIIIPIIDNDVITGAYTVGLWYYWGLPEIIISCDGTNSHCQYFNILIEMIRRELFNTNENIIRRDVFNYSNSPSNLCLSINKYDIVLELKKLDETDYLSKKTLHMFWFYMFYMEAELDDLNEPILFPVYCVDLNDKQCNQIIDKIFDNIVDNIIENENYSSDINSVDSNESD